MRSRIIKGLVAILLLIIFIHYFFYINLFNKLVFAILLGISFAVFFILISYLYLFKEDIDPYAEFKKSYSMFSDDKTVVEVDIDNFKLLNLLYGEEFLFDLVDKLKNEICSNFVGTVLYRKYEDHFIFLVKSMNSKELTSKLKNINIEINKILNDDLLGVNLSFGVYKPVLGEDFASAMEKVNVAFSNSKLDSNKNITFYKEKQLNILIEDRKKVDDIINSLKNNDAKIVYQAKCNENGKVVGYEAILKIKVNDRYLTKKEYLEIAEQNDFITVIDKYVLKRVCKLIAKFKEENIEFGKIAVNISRKTLSLIDLEDYVNKLFNEYNITKDDIEFELPEDAFDTQSEFIDDFVASFGKKYDIVVDNFGVGQSSLDILKHSKIKTIKIDKSFLKEQNDEEKQVLKSLANLVKDLGFTVACDGIDSEETLAFIKGLKFSEVQGSFMSKMLEEDKLYDSLKKND